MKLDNKYYIETDANNFILRFEEKYLDLDKGKEVTSKNEWFCRDMAHALNIYMNESIKPSVDIISLREELKRIEELIKSVSAKTIK